MKILIDAMGGDHAPQEIVKGALLAHEKFGAGKITVHAQTYVKSMYEKAGFVQVSDEFPEDGIPHIKMELTLS